MSKNVPRQTRSKATQDENASINTINARITRAKAAASGGLQSSALDPTALTRRRAALGDLSNVNKPSNSNTSAKPSISRVSNANPHTALKSRQAPKILLGSSSSRTAGIARSNVAKPGLSIRRDTEPLKIESGSTSSAIALPRKRSAGELSVKVDVASYEIEKLENAESSSSTTVIHAIDHISKKLRTIRSPENTAEPIDDDDDDEQIQPWDDLDEEDQDDPLMVSEYVVDIFDYLYKIQYDYMAPPDYMNHQKYLQWEMRGILIDWIVEVHQKFRLLPETLFLAVNIIDRFLSLRKIGVDKVQLAGIASLIIASKYEEVFTPSIRNFAYMVDGGYDEQEILDAERFVLQTINFNLSYPNPMNFLRRISKADNYDIQTRTIGKYLLEITLLDHRFIKYPPSEAAAASMYLSRKILGRRGIWHSNLIHYSGDCDEQTLMPIVKLMVDYLANPVIHEAFFKKYASKRFLKASLLARQWCKEHRDSYALDLEDDDNLFEGDEDQDEMVWR